MGNEYSDSNLCVCETQVIAGPNGGKGGGLWSQMFRQSNGNGVKIGESLSTGYPTGLAFLIGTTKASGTVSVPCSMFCFPAGSPSTPELK